MVDNKTNRALTRLQAIMDTLRSPTGCPWDAKQTPESLKTYILEEAYEVLEAIDSGDPDSICEELGDLLLQVVFQASIFKERRQFDFADVANTIADKMVRRHPHVFENIELRDPELLRAQWDRIKRAEKEKRGIKPTIHEGVSASLPALLRARKVADKTSRAEFDAAGTTEAFNRTRSMLQRFAETAGTAERIEVEMDYGDLIFSVVQLGRHFDLDAEEALRRSTNRIVARLEDFEGDLQQGERGRKRSTGEAPDCGNALREVKT